MTDAGADATMMGQSTSPSNLGCAGFESHLRIASEDLYYDTTGKKYMIIFNHYRFKEKRFGYSVPHARTGTMEDVNMLTRLFQDLRYEVIVYNDLDYIEILRVMKDLTSQDHESTSCLCFAFLTMEIRGNILAADASYNLQDLTDMFGSGHTSLVGKPKIFFTGRGNDMSLDRGRRLEMDGGRVSRVVPAHADLFFLYASVGEHVSFRTANGSFLIMELCDVIREFHEVWDILRISTLVHRRVAFHREAYCPPLAAIHRTKQMPETRHTLTKFFKF